MELDDVIKGRHSVRDMSDEEVSDEDIISIIDAARISPSWANNQPWKFIAIRDKVLAGQVDPRVPASVLIVACAKVGESGYIRGEETTKFKEWFMFDLGIASYGLCLKAYELGLGSVIMGNLKHDKIKKLLHIPKDYEPIVIIPIGKPEEKVRKEKDRKDLSEILYSEKFGKAFIK